MYSVVLAVALTSGGDVSALGHGCNGGNWGCYGGCYSFCGCTGGGHGHHNSCRGGGFFGGHHNSCYGGGYGCGGGHKHHRGHGCCGYSGCGCYGYSACGCGNNSCGCGCGSSYGGGWGGYGIGGGTVVPGTVVPTNPTTPSTPGKKSSIEGSAPATLVVNIPADARLTIDGEATTSTSAKRTFVTPALEAGRTFHYTLQAEIIKDGKTITVKKNVAVKAGEESRVSIDADNVEFIDN